MATNHQQQQQQQLASPFVAMAAEPAARDELDDKLLVLCTECSHNYEREASAVKAEAAADEEGPRAAGNLPGWLVPEPPKVGERNRDVNRSEEVLI